MVRVWVAGKTVCSPCYTRAISERFRDKELIYKALYKFAFFFYFLYFSPIPLLWETSTRRRKRCDGESIRQGVTLKHYSEAVYTLLLRAANAVIPEPADSGNGQHTV